MVTIDSWKTKFRGQLRDVQGGTLEATSRQAAVDHLLGQSMTPIQVVEATGVLKGRSVRDLLSTRVERLSPTNLLSFTQQLAALVKAGLTLERALGVAQQLVVNRSEKRLFDALHSSVRRGRSFAEALSDSGATLPSYFIGMVQAGEISGSLPESLGRLAQLLEQASQTRERIVSALIYPAILLTTIGMTLILIVTFVLPRFESLFSEAGAQLPLPTQIVMAFGHLLRDDGWAIIGLATLMSFMLRRLWRNREHRLSIDSKLLKIRLYFRTMGKADAARFSRTLGMLIGGGLPLPSSMRIAISTLRNAALRYSAEQALEGVNAGQDLAIQLHRLGGFPPLLLQMIRVGLETGRLQQTLLEAADMLDAESQRSIERSVSAVIPLVTIVMGLLVAALIGSVLVGILSINDLAG